MAAERLVIDSGYLLEALLPTRREWKHQADRLLESMVAGSVRGLVPYLFLHEIASVCARKLRARKVDSDSVELFLELVEQSGFHLDLTIAAPSTLYLQALRMGCQVGDAVYLELARVNELPIATVDGGLRTAARTAGVPLWDG